MIRISTVLFQLGLACLIAGVFQYVDHRFCVPSSLSASVCTSWSIEFARGTDVPTVIRTSWMSGIIGVIFLMLAIAARLLEQARAMCRSDAKVSPAHQASADAV